jgi:hypothetical protein
MSIDAVSSLRRRMIEDMNARKLCAGGYGGFPQQSVGFLQLSVLFLSKPQCGAGFSVSLSHGDNMQGAA